LFYNRQFLCRTLYIDGTHKYHKGKQGLLGGNRQFGLEVNTEKTGCIDTSRNQNVGQTHNLLSDNKSFENLEKLKYLGTTLTDQNCFRGVITSSLNAGNACCHSVQRVLSSHLLSKILETEIYKTINFPVLPTGVKLDLSN
jgi:hypothetical protein